MVRQFCDRRFDEIGRFPLNEFRDFVGELPTDSATLFHLELRPVVDRGRVMRPRQVVNIWDVERLHQLQAWSSRRRFPYSIRF